MDAKECSPRFPWGSFLKNLAAIALPIAFQNLLTTTASMVDTMMVAPLGELSVGALGLCAQFSSLMFSGYWGFVLRLPYWAIFLCCYIDEPIRYVLMQIHLYSGKWVKPVTEAGMAALPGFREKRRQKI